MHNPGKQRGRMSGDIRPHCFVACLTADRRLAAGRGPGGARGGAAPPPPATATAASVSTNVMRRFPNSTNTW